MAKAANLRRAAAHARTIWAELGDRIWPVPGPHARPFETTLQDPVMGAVRLRGLFGDAPESDAVVVIVPGITGTAASPYCARAAWAAECAGLAHLRIGMRGTDCSGEDLWHGGLTDDLRAALSSRELARFRRVLLLGYSVGGHVALRAAAERIDARIRAVAAVCPPLDLELGTQAFDRPERRVYRRHILAALDRIYAATTARRSLPTPLAVVRRARSSRERDALAIAPRFGFRSAEDYYERASVAPLLPRLSVPALVVAAPEDPVVAPEAILPALEAARGTVEVRWTHGGHIAFPASTDLGLGRGPGVESQLIGWLARV